MKNKIKVLMVLFACTLGHFACKPVTNQNPSTSTQATLFTYSFEQRAELGINDTQKFIKQFLGETDFKNLVKSSEGIVYFTSEADLSANLEQDLTTGNFTFNKSMKKYMGDYVPDLPKPAEAVKMAETYLRDNQLFPKNQTELKLVHQGGLRSMNVVEGNKAGTIVDKMITLTYGRLIDSMTVIGPGSKIVVQVGEKGEVMGMVHRWRELNNSSKKAIEPAAMISQQEAETLAKRQIAAEYGANASFTIKNSYKAYYDNNGKLLQPVYVFETNLVLEDKKVRPFDYLCVIPVLKNSPEPLQLITTDGRAKEAIRNVKKGEGSGAPNDKKNKD